MKRRKWTAKQKLQIVLEGMSGRVALAQLCPTCPLALFEASVSLSIFVVSYSVSFPEYSLIPTQLLNGGSILAFTPHEKDNVIFVTSPSIIHSSYDPPHPIPSSHDTSHMTYR